MGKGDNACPCDSGLRRRECCFDPEKLRTWIFDHPKLHRVWDTRALNAQHARLNFRKAWDMQAADGRLLAAGLRPRGAPLHTLGKPVDPTTFGLGVVRLDDGQEPPEVPEDAFGDDEIPGIPDETWLPGHDDAAGGEQ